MRKYKHIPLLAAAALPLLAGCAKDPALLDAGSITIDANICAPTKVAYDGATSRFSEGDQIAVYAWTGSATEIPASRVVDGVVNTFDGGAWTPASVMYWKTASDAHYFLGVSPVHVINDFAADAYTVDPANYIASDLLFAANLDGVKSGDGDVKLAFRHAMAKLVVNLSFRDQFGGTPDVSAVTLSAKTKANVNYLKQVVSATGDAASVSLPAATANGSYSAILVPQDGVRKVAVTIAGKDYVYTAGEDIPLASGQVTTLNLIVGKDRVELSGVTVDEWANGGMLADGGALPQINGHGYVDLGLPSGLKWATCNVGAENPEDYGDYFAWGETEPYYSSQEPLVWKDGKGSGYVWSSYFDTSDGGNTFTKYTKDKKTVLEAIDDAVTANWGKDLKTIETVIWQNPDPNGQMVNWSGQYRFAGEGHETSEEIWVVPADQWEKMKTCTFYVVFKEPGAQIRITTGWWSTYWTGNDIFVGNERVTENEDGTYTLAVTLAGDPILDLIDDQHLLLTGGGYIPLKLYFAEQVAPWRMPTDAEWTELRTKCTWTWTTRNGVKGYLVSNNGDSLFLPAAGYRNGTGLYDAGSNGYYWSSSLDTGDPDHAWNVDFYSGGAGRSYGERYYGLSVRPVLAF